MLYKIIEVGCAFLLPCKVAHHLHQTFGREDSVSLHNLQFQVDPEELVIDHIPVQELAQLQEGLLLRVYLDS